MPPWPRAIPLTWLDPILLGRGGLLPCLLALMIWNKLKGLEVGSQTLCMPICLDADHAAGKGRSSSMLKSKPILSSAQCAASQPPMGKNPAAYRPGSALGIRRGSHPLVGSNPPGPRAMEAKAARAVTTIQMKTWIKESKDAYQLLGASQRSHLPPRSKEPTGANAWSGTLTSGAPSRKRTKRGQRQRSNTLGPYSIYLRGAMFLAAEVGDIIRLKAQGTKP